ncbi:YHYH protein [Rubinisphaera italica]|nr:YHYH protein [Rubinisphaera italica]
MNFQYDQLFRVCLMCGGLFFRGVQAEAHDAPGQPAHTHLSGNSSASRVTMAEKGEYRIVTSNGLPDHQPGQFPRRGNPNRVSAQQYQFRMPLQPEQARTVTPVGMNRFGVALNGVPFDPGAAEFWNRDRRSGWQYEANSGKINLGLDEHHAHVQPDGGYHYHGLPTGLVEIREESSSHTDPILIGYAADGFPIYSSEGYRNPQDLSSGLKRMKSSYRVKSGQRPGGPGKSYDGTFVEDYEFVEGSGDLDECNGREGVTPEYPGGIYHYYVTEDFPFIPRYFRGTPDASFAKRGPPFPGGPGRRPPFPPPR